MIFAAVFIAILAVALLILAKLIVGEANLGADSAERFAEEVERIRRRVPLILLALLLLAPTPAQAQAPECGEGDAWFFSEDTWTLWLQNFEETKRCAWGTPEDENSLQRTGYCGLPEQQNRLMVLTHNWYCNADHCPTGVGGVSDIPLLEAGERVQLCEYGRLWRGRVTESFFVGDSDPQPQTDFDCGLPVCGTIVTSVGNRAGRYGPAEGYWLVRMAYR